MKRRTMKRTNFYFPEQVLLRLKKARQQTGYSVSELMRRAVENLLQELGV